MSEIISRLEELAIENAKLKVTIEDLMEKNKELERARDILASTCKLHNDFFDEIGIREGFQEFFENKIKEEQNNE